MIMLWSHCSNIVQIFDVATSWRCLITRLLRNEFLRLTDALTKERQTVIDQQLICLLNLQRINFEAAEVALHVLIFFNFVLIYFVTSLKFHYSFVPTYFGKFLNTGCLNEK